MDDIVKRLRKEGESALRKHLSLGMHDLCTEAANEIERLRDKILKIEMTRRLDAQITAHT